MAIITEDYVGFEIAKLLKEKGFDGNCFYIWVKTDKNEIPSLLATANFVEGETITNRETLDVVTQYHINIYGLNSKIESFLCPTLQMAMKWLREVHNLFIQIGIIPHTTITIEQKYYFFTVHKDRRTLVFRKDFPSEYYFTYEEAYEAAIKYCLENLI